VSQHRCDIIFLVAAALVCVAAAGQIAATRDEDAEGHVEHLVARRVGRLHWLDGRLLADVTPIPRGEPGRRSRRPHWPRLRSAVKAGVNIALPALFVLGVGILTYGW